ncbi:nuclease-related domain-containing protein [Cellulomonas denverensis]|uniref:NERD domain-containing protein n=1 Tax=Cellulomonas denverensis TaxID=264297 RepID=A0A7X6KXM7_9CELL|nr:nuclease-related domain-containing protein [Cellulomonas denverensis]NKY23914.1 hypothetical protein [Cellulomonas denverensis]GIG24966.1 hypothetical protein Cde04nite_12100 [Cellulomonas denverensis]
MIRRTARGHDWLGGTGMALAEVEPDGWTVLHDLHRPGSAWADIERIVVGPGGILVLQTVPGHGDATVSAGTLRMGHDVREVATVAGAAGAVTALLAPEHRRLVRPVLVLEDQELAPTVVHGGALVVGTHRLAGHLRSMMPVLPLAELPLIVDYLTAELGGDDAPEQLTVDDVLHGGAVRADTEAAELARALRASILAPAPAPPRARRTRGDLAVRLGTLGLLLATLVNVVLAVRGG